MQQPNANDVRKMVSIEEPSIGKEKDSALISLETSHTHLLLYHQNVQIR